VQDDYRLFIGSTTLDLSEVEFEREPTPVSAGVGIGQLEVIVPSDARVEVDGRVRAGEIEAFGERQQGSNLDFTTSDPGSELGGRLELDLNAGFGVVSVRRASD
jgi:predicted membrane protein